MALIRAEIRQRLGDSSIYDGIVEYQEDFEQERMLASMHPGSLMLCLNYQYESESEENTSSDLYIKRESGSWEIVGSAGGGGGEVTPDSIVAATEQMTTAQSLAMLSSIGAEPATVFVEVTLEGSTYSADKTFEDIESAYISSKSLVAKDESGVQYPLTDYSAIGTAEFSTVAGGKVKSFTVQSNGIGQNDTWSYLETDIDPVNATTVASAIHAMSAAQKSTVRTDIGAEPQRLIATVTQSGSTYSANKTFSEMWTAYHTDHKTVTVAFAEDEFVLSSADPSGMAFASLSVGPGNAMLFMLTVDENDDWSYAEFAAGVYTVTVSGTTPTITPVDNTAYNCGELASLTISNPPVTGAYSIVFTSGATATVTTFPATILGLESFAAEANTVYEINVLDGRAVYNGWPLPTE